MKVPDDVICQVCRRIFCCPECRSKHEIKNHAIVVHKPPTKTRACSNGDGNDDDDSRNFGGAVMANNVTIYLFCPICAKKPLLLKEAMYCEMLEHIKNNHLPLNCQKCSKTYTNVEDLKDFSKCIQPQMLCMEDKPVKYMPLNDLESPQNHGKAIHSTIATQTSPMPPQIDYSIGSHITPFSTLNLHLKTKSTVTHDFISDSVSSIRNISSISHSSSARSIGILSNVDNGKLVRTTSTPLQTEVVFTKPKEHTTFNAQVSSIYNSETEGVPVPNPAVTPSHRSAIEIHRYRKVGGRSKMMAVTPLRHVMSKSIQKAIAEHGLAGPVQEDQNRKKRIESSYHNIAEQQCANGANKLCNSPLDLRLSPALRRTCNEAPKPMMTKDRETVPQQRQEILLSSKKTTTQSIVITRLQSESNSINSERNGTYFDATNISSSSSASTAGSIYQTCHSVEIITSTELNGVKVRQNSCYSTEKAVAEFLPADRQSALAVETNCLAPITPRARTKGAIIKKNHIVFETPTLEESNPPNEAFFTPEASPVQLTSLAIESTNDVACKTPLRPRKLSNHFSPYRRPSLHDFRIENLDGKKDKIDDEDFKLGKELNEEENKKPQPSGLWSLMASVMRLPSFAGTQTNKSPTSHSLIKRCSSIAGSIVRQKPVVEDDRLQSLKRKRTYTADYNSTYFTRNQSSDPTIISDASSSKRFRIHGRKPIERMRANS